MSVGLAQRTIEKLLLCTKAYTLSQQVLNIATILS